MFGLLRIMLVAAILIALLFPFVEMMSTALKARGVLYKWPPLWFPATPEWSNHLQVWDRRAARLLLPQQLHHRRRGDAAQRRGRHSSGICAGPVTGQAPENAGEPAHIRPECRRAH